jgi:ornithine carbamoyltransferase
MTLRHFLEIDDLAPTELIAVLDASEAQLTAVLARRGIALLFEKPSLRTRNSAEMAVVQLGGHPAYVTNAEIALDVRESVEDVTRTLNGYYAAIAARVFEHDKLVRMCRVANVPIINLLSDEGHPVQALADLLTLRQEFGNLQGHTIGWVGDFSNVARSLALGGAMLGMHFRFGGPAQYGPSKTDLDRFAQRSQHGATLSVFTRPDTAVEGVSVVTTDAWYSMGQEDEKDLRRQAMEGCTVNAALMDRAASNAVFLHCLPAHRGEEVTGEVLEGPASRVWPQAHNRMHTFRGLLTWLVDQGAIA